jgi:hypothetical protein
MKTRSSRHIFSLRMILKNILFKHELIVMFSSIALANIFPKNMNISLVNFVSEIVLEIINEI